VEVCFSIAACSGFGLCQQPGADAIRPYKTISRKTVCQPSVGMNLVCFRIGSRSFFPVTQNAQQPQQKCSAISCPGQLICMKPALAITDQPAKIMAFASKNMI
jgi:hypothetical protein